MRPILLLMTALAVLSLSGCAAFYVAPVQPPPGFIYADIKAPIDTDAQKTNVSSKSGESSSMSILGLIALGDASVDAASKAGGIKTIDQVDYQFYNILGIYSKFTTKVYGE